MTAFDPVTPALSKPALASAALLVACIRTTDKSDRRTDLIREMVNAGMDDDEAVEFLALTVMPLEMLEAVSVFIANPDIHKTDIADHRQNFFRFANDAFHTLPWEEACTVVTNGMMVNPVFTYNDCMLERVASLRSHGVDCSGELSRKDVVYAKGLIALMDSWPFLDDRKTSELTFASVDDSNLAALVRDTGERYPELIQLIRERSTLEVAMLRAVMESPSPAVRSGML